MAPTPDPAGSAGVATMSEPPASNGPYPVPDNYAPYFERSFAVTEAVPNVYYDAPAPFGPIMMFETNLNSGLGYDDGYQRINARVPYHIIPNTNVLIGDFSASVTYSGAPIANGGLVYRRYDDLRNRVFGVNTFIDYDQGYGNTEWYRGTVGVESLGQYIDFRANGYFVLGDDSLMLSDTPGASLFLQGNNILRSRTQVRENAYSGFDAEVGGPLPVLGQYGLNMYAGGYLLGNDNGYDTVGFQARWEALITQNMTVNTYLSTDETFGTNTWVGIQYEIPNYKNRRTLRPRGPVRERLQDPVVRSTRIHTNLDTRTFSEARINDVTNNPYFIAYVDPNINTAGTGAGTFEDPFRSMAALTNGAGIDVIRVTPNTDGSGVDLTVNGGLSLFDNQALISSNSDYELFRIGTTPFYIPGTGATGPGPLLTRPNISAGESIVRLANNNTISGMRFDASNAAGTAFGNGISNPLPITDLNLTGNTFSNYVVGADLQDVSGRVIVDGNTFTGRSPVAAIRSTYGLKMNVAGNQTMDLLLNGNTATTNQMAGLSVTAGLNSTLNADDLNGNTAFVPPATGKYVFDQEVTGITNNVLAGNGNGIEVIGQIGSTINAVVEDNTSTNNTENGFVGRTNGGTFNLASMRSNLFFGNEENGAFLHYLNGGNFRSVSEDLDGNGALDIGEDLNSNGLLDQGIVSNTMSSNGMVGLCIFGEGSGDGSFDIGGETPLLGNLFVANANGGIAADLSDTATGTINAFNNRIFAVGQPTSGDVIRTGFGQNILPGNDDLSSGLVNTGFVMNFFGQVFNDLTVNNNGNVTFNGPLASFTPFGLLNTATPIIAPFFADVDTRLGSVVTYGTGVADGRQAFGVNYADVRHFSVNGPNQGLPTNDFQLVLIDRSDVSPGDFDIEFNYDRILWEAGTASGSDQFGLGGSTARVGYSNGVDRAFELPGSAVPGAFLDSGPAETSLVQNSLNSSTLGRYFFESRSGNITSGAAVANSDGISVRLSDNATLQPSRFVNNTISQSLGTGLSISASDNATVSNVEIQGNSINRSRESGVSLVADGPNASITTIIGGNGENTLGGQAFSQGNTIESNGTSGTGDGIEVLAKNGAVISGGIVRNSVIDNGGNGISLTVDNGGTLNFGDVINDQTITRNSIRSNAGAGLRLVSGVTPTTDAELNAVVQGNTISKNAGGGIVSELNGLNAAPPNSNVLNLTVNDSAFVDLTAEQNRNFITGNSDVGIGVAVGGNGLANVVLSNVSVTDTINGADPLRNGDGIALTRSGASLLTATLNSVDVTGNAGDGLEVDAQGNDRTDPKQPDSGTPNTVTVTDSNFSDNGQNGAVFQSRGNATLIGDVSQSTFSGNGSNGILVNTSQAATFGDNTAPLPVPPGIGRRSLFDGNTITNNAVDGVQINATEESKALVEITSNLAAVVPSPHAAANSLGTTSISNNGRDGVRIATNGGVSDILITSGTANTLINGNGTGAAGGNGVRWDASGTSKGYVRITRTTITNSQAGVSEDTNGNGVLDAGEDLNGNGDIDVAEGDGIQANFSENATATLTVGNAGNGNVIQSNEDDGIAITATGSNATGNPRPIITIADNIIGGTNNGNAAGNGGDGVSMQLFGGTRAGLAPGTVDNDANGDGFIDAFITDDNVRVSAFHLFVNDHSGVTESGAVPQFTMSGNTVTNNASRGVNLLLNGAGGERDRENGSSTFDPIRITLNDNEIAANGAEGVYYRADSDMNQSRFVYLANFPIVGPPANDNLNFSPFRPEFLNMNVGSVNGNTAYLSPYLNLRTVQNSLFTMNNNTIQNNGTAGATGEGVRIDVGTGAYVAADIRNNTFGGNLEQDLVTSSFLSLDNTFTSVNVAGNLTYDYVYLDDTAQLDMRFLNNNGNEIAVSDVGAVYTNADTLKFNANFGNREAALFQVDNGPNLNNPNNVFTNSNGTQDIQNAFTTGGYNLRAIADPAYPNIGFAPFLP